MFFVFNLNNETKINTGNLLGNKRFNNNSACACACEYACACACVRVLRQLWLPYEITEAINSLCTTPMYGCKGV